MPRAGNVIPLRDAAVQPFQLASVHSPGRALNGSRNRVWLCPAYSGAQNLVLYVKPNLSVRQMVAELLCAQLARAIGLPSPPSYLVSVPPQHVGMPRGPVILTFGCEQVGGRSQARVIKDVDLLFAAMQKAKAFNGACMFDEWTANPVRHANDVVHDPFGGVWLIDHEGALGAGLEPDEAVANWLADRFRERLELRHQVQFLQALRKCAAAAGALVLSPPSPDLQAVPGASETWREVVLFLEARLAHLDRLLSQRALPQQAYLEEPCAPAAEKSNRPAP